LITQGRIEIETYQPQRIERDVAVRREPVEVRAGHPSRGADLADQLAAPHRVSDRDQGAAQVQVPGNEPRAVIDQHGGAAQVQVGDQSDDAAVRRLHRSAAPPGEVDAQVTAARKPSGPRSKCSSSPASSPRTVVTLSAARERSSSKTTEPSSGTRGRETRRGDPATLCADTLGTPKHATHVMSDRHTAGMRGIPERATLRSARGRNPHTTPGVPTNVFVFE